ncbi:MAG TPA: LacI family DNA-binding transcriptional regulator [Balneolaceae bacterium]|nr:LacI family DNA-binding transcriptional regulator [Balneolaceae bacterium]
MKKIALVAQWIVQVAQTIVLEKSYMAQDISIKFIAEKSGFSPSTVSRVMNGNAREYRISEETEKKILRLADKYDYKPNPVAVSLRVKKSYTIGLVIPSLDNPFFVNVTSILNKELTKKGYNIILTESEDNPEVEAEVINQLLERNIDGLILIPCKEKDKNIGLLESKFEDGIPIICIDRYVKNSKIPYLTTNNEKGAYEGVKYLIERGHKKIACIQGLVESTPSVDRKNGYLAALKEYGLEPFFIGGDAFSIECGERETKKLLKNKEKPTAIFAMSSTIALGVMKTVNEFNYKIPDDFSLMGFDDNIFLDYLSTPLTTIAQPVNEISERAVKALIDHLNGTLDLSNWSSAMLDTKIVHRKSVN